CPGHRAEDSWMRSQRHNKEDCVNDNNKAKSNVEEISWPPKERRQEGAGNVVPVSGLSAVPAGKPTRSVVPIHDWEDPDWSILEDRRGKLPPFPIETLPLPWQGWVRRAARGAGVTIDHVAVPLLGISSGLIGTARRIKPSMSWSEPCSLWVGVVGFSG